ncbi:MAG TPA: DUF642 domain-containing protein [Candidatus Eisenbacteria bacterium]|nr:DUF642 domain-containing protein [Candidatus Eisenbacteria bacterium]
MTRRTRFREDGSVPRESECQASWSSTLRVAAVALALLALVVAALPPPVCSEPCPEDRANLVQNGDFESTPGAAPYLTLSAEDWIGAWRIRLGAVDLIDSSYWSPIDGRHSLDLDGSCGAGAIVQRIGVDPGRSYLLCYAVCGNVDGGPDVKTLEVRWEGVRVDSVAFDASAASYRNMMWARRQVVVKAASLSADLEFRSLTEGCYGPVIDEISLRELTPVLP